MLQKVLSIGLTVDENMIVYKNHLEPENQNHNRKRICIVTGVHGDELEGQYVCYELIRKLNQNLKYLRGIVDIYPALNPLGLDSVTRGFPMFDLDMNSIFPGSENGAMPEYAASKVIEDILGSDLCIDVHASNIYLREIPQVRMREESAGELLEYAKLLNTNFVWIHNSPTVSDATLAHSLNAIGVPTLAVEMGVGMRITKEYGNQLIDGIFMVMKSLGIWEGPVNPVKEPIVSTDGQVGLVYAETSGIFMPCIEHWESIEEGERMGDIVDPMTGMIVQEVLSPCYGMVFTLREYPVVNQGSLIARILGGSKYDDGKEETAG